MPKVLSQAGNSLADIYDVRGSVAGIETLETHELPIVHEMGGTVFSERLSGAFSRSTTGALAQNTTWDIAVTGLGNGISRILGLVVFTTDAARLTEVTASVRDSDVGREVPIFIWDLNEAVIGGRIQDDGAAVGSVAFLSNAGGGVNLPSLLIGDEQPQPIPEVAFRGLTSGFGAGTVTTTLVFYRAFSETAGAGVSSRGLPIPGW